MPKRKPAIKNMYEQVAKKPLVATTFTQKKIPQKKDYRHLLATVPSGKSKQKKATFLDKVLEKIEALGELAKDMAKPPIHMLKEGPDGELHLHADMEEHMNRLLGNENVKKFSKVMNTIVNGVEKVIEDPSELVDLLHKIEQTTLGGAAMTMLAASNPEIVAGILAFEMFLDLADIAVEAIKFAADPDKSTDKLHNLAGEIGKDSFDLLLAGVQYITVANMPNIAEGSRIPKMSPRAEKLIKAGANQAANYAETINTVNNVLKVFGVSTASSDAIAERANQASAQLEKVGVKGEVNQTVQEVEKVARIAQKGLHHGKKILSGTGGLEDVDAVATTAQEGIEYAQQNQYGEKISDELQSASDTLNKVKEGVKFGQDLKRTFDKVTAGVDELDTVVKGVREGAKLAKQGESLVKNFFGQSDPTLQIRGQEEPEYEQVFERITNIEYDTPFLYNPPNEPQSGALPNDTQKFFAAYAAALYKAPSERDTTVKALAKGEDTGTIVFNEANDAAWLRGDVVIVAFRGTIPTQLADLLSDATIAIGKEELGPRFMDGEKLLANVKDQYPDKKIILTGHSLGGTIAYYLRTKADRVYTFNMGTFAPRELHLPNVAQKLLEYMFSTKNKNAVNYYVPGDVISAGVRLMEGAVAVPNKQGLGAHDKFNFL